MINTSRYTIKFNKVVTCVYLCLLPLLISLGFWQLHRADEKQILLNRQAQSEMADAMNLSVNSEDNVDLYRYEKVEVTGRYDVLHQFLIDNQISGGKAGYFVLTPLLLDGANKAVLINRGWVPLNQDRSILPDVQLASFQGVVKGRINRFPSVGLKLPGADVPTDSWPSVVQVVDSEKLAQRLGYPLFHFQIELDKAYPDGFKREWQTLQIMQPEQHVAYAIQWFGLALTLTIVFIVNSIKRNND